jgi:polyhydroxyalkanoate synthesis regulator phasin
LRKKWGLFAIAGVAAAALLAIAALVVGPAQAQLGSGDPEARHQRYLELLAENLGISVEQLKDAQESARDQLIDEAVAAGNLTPDEAEALKDRAFPPSERHARIGRFAFNLFSQAAETLGLSGAEIRSGLREGKSLADLAAEQGVSNFEERLANAVEAKLQNAVDQGKLSQEQANRIRASLTDRIDHLVNHQGVPGEKMRPPGALPFGRK